MFDQKFSAYLFAYFTGNEICQEAIHFAVSKDGYHFMALNKNQPVIDSVGISSTGGVRDPHIIRGIDNSFYMVATDMVSSNGWESNRAMLLMRSEDLIHWTSAVVNIQVRFEGQDDLLRVWAPQTIYDPIEKRYMIYWSMKHGHEPDKLYYSYANDAFTDLMHEPKQLFKHPQSNSCIDGDIVNYKGRWHLFFKDHDHMGIQVAASDHLTHGYVLHDGYVDQTDEDVEGPCIFQLNDTDEYILMYDVYMKGRYQFTHTNDLRHFRVIDQEVFLDFSPRHGSVMQITDIEGERLIGHWG